MSYVTLIHSKVWPTEETNGILVADYEIKEKKKYNIGNFNKLNDDIFYIVISFLIEYKQIEKNAIPLIISCKYFEKKYGQIGIFKLGNSLSKAYLENKDFRDKLSNYLRPCSKVFYNFKIPVSIELDYSEIDDKEFVNLDNVYRLTINDCYRPHRYLPTVFINKVKDVSMISNVHELYLRFCGELEDVSMLGGLNKLILCKCSKVKDISMLGGIKILFISSCNGITYVSKLSNIKILVIEDCKGISDVSMLGSVEKLVLQNCPHIDSSMLENKCSWEDVSTNFYENFY